MDDNEQDYTTREDVWDEADPTIAAEMDPHPPAAIDEVDELEPFPEEVGTRNVIDAVRDAEPYVPPNDPPVLPGGKEGIHTATGFGTDVVEEAAREPSPRGDEDI